jgi:hypothetical protein
MKRALSQGVEIAYEDAGHGEPALVLIQAPFGNRSHLAPVFDHLSKRHRVIALDLRGRGESAMPLDGFRILDFASDVRAVCRAAEVNRAVLFPEPLRRQVLEHLVPALAGPGWREALHGYMASRMFGPFDPPEVRARIAQEIDTFPAHIAAPLMHDGMSSDSSEAASRSFPHRHVRDTCGYTGGWRGLDSHEIGEFRQEFFDAEGWPSGRWRWS